jgi:hypothetical protein
MHARALAALTSLMAWMYLAQRGWMKSHVSSFLVVPERASAWARRISEREM